MVLHQVATRVHELLGSSVDACFKPSVFRRFAQVREFVCVCVYVCVYGRGYVCVSYRCVGCASLLESLIDHTLLEH
jgi:hypothetical protein